MFLRSFNAVTSAASSFGDRRTAAHLGNLSTGLSIGKAPCMRTVFGLGLSRSRLCGIKKGIVFSCPNFLQITKLRSARGECQFIDRVNLSPRMRIFLRGCWRGMVGGISVARCCVGFGAKLIRHRVVGCGTTAAYVLPQVPFEILKPRGLANLLTSVNSFRYASIPNCAQRFAPQCQMRFQRDLLL